MRGQAREREEKERRRQRAGALLRTDRGKEMGDERKCE